GWGRDLAAPVGAVDCTGYVSVHLETFLDRRPNLRRSPPRFGAASDRDQAGVTRPEGEPGHDLPTSFDENSSLSRDHTGPCPARDGFSHRYRRPGAICTVPTGNVNGIGMAISPATSPPGTGGT